MVARSVLLAFAFTVVASSATASSRFPATKVSSRGGHGRAKTAFYVCGSSLDFGKFATAGIADASCAKLARLRCPTCRPAARQAAPVYGPYRYPVRHGKDDWFSANDYPYETLDGRQYSRAGYVPTP